jgi:hypothetical protein
MGGEKQIMPRYFSMHTFPPDAFTKEQLGQLSQMAVKDPVVTSVRFEGNLKDGKMYCVFEAPSKQTFEEWLKNHKIPYDFVTQTTIACEGGATVRDI